MGEYGKIDKEIDQGYGMLGTDSILNEKEAAFTNRTAVTINKRDGTNKQKKTEDIVMEEVI